MKRAFVIAIVALVVLTGLMLASLPPLLSSTHVRSLIQKEIEERFKADVQFKGLALAYLPRPNLTIQRLHILKDNVDIQAEEVQVFPNPRWLIQGGYLIKEIEFSKGLLQKKYEVNRGQVNLSDEGIDLKTTCFIGRRCNLSITGTIDPNQGDANLTIDAKDLDLRPITSFFMKRPLEGRMEKGRVLLEANIRRRDALRIKIPGISMSVPRFGTKGEIYVYKRRDGVFLDIDTIFTQAHLGEIRSSLLPYLKGHKDLTKVLEIVRGGKAKEARFKFSGNVQDLKHVENIYVEAVGEKVSIHIPEIDLDIPWASGPIRIEKGKLMGKGLKAGLRHTDCRDADLFLGLTGKEKHIAFSATLHSNGDDIIWALNKFVKDTSFRERLKSVHPGKGHATGKLTIEGPLRHCNVKVDAWSDPFIEAKIYPLHYPIRLTSGNVNVDTKAHTIKLHKVGGTFGNTKIREVYGWYSWKGERPFKLRVKDSTIKLDEIFKTLSLYPYLHKRIKKVVTSSSGTLHIARGQAKGKLSALKKTQFQLHVDKGKLKFTSPLLPSSIKVNTINGLIEPNKFKLQDLQVSTNSGTSVKLTCDIMHKDFHAFSGNIYLEGMLKKEFSPWLRGKAWIPLAFFPQFPVTVNGLDIELRPTKKTVYLKGDLSWTHGENATSTSYPNLRFTLEKQPHTVVIKPCQILDTDSNANLGISIKEPTGPSRTGTFSFDFKGTLTGRTLNEILANNQFLAGKMDGKLSFCVGQCSPSPFIESHLKGGGFLWQWGIRRPVMIDDFLFETKGPKTVQIKKITVKEGHTVVKGKGELKAGIQGFSVYFKGRSKDINVSSVTSLFSKEEGKKKKTRERKHGITQLQKEKKFTFPKMISETTLDLLIDRVHYQNHTFSNIYGVLQYSEEGKLGLEVTSGKVCGMNCAAFLPNLKEIKSGRFRFWTVQDNKARFQDVLSCLGVSDNILEGEFEADISLEGIPEKWQKGFISISGGPGELNHTIFLSKLFSIINVLDIFKGKIFESGLPFSDLEVKGPITENKLELKRFVMKAQGLNFFGTGTVDLSTLNVDMDLLVAPFKTVDFILSKIPLLGYAIGGANRTLITVPVKVKGPIKAPEVFPLHPESLGKGVLNLLKDVVTVPVRIVVPEKGEK